MSYWSTSYMYKENEQRLEVRQKVQALQCFLCKQGFFNRFNQYNSPKILPQCGHTVCNVCVEEKLLPKGYNAEHPVSVRVKCPFCKTSSQISEKGIQDMPTNVALKKAAEFVAHRLEKIAYTSDHCPHLAMVDQPIVCRHCKGQYCKDCIIRHKETIRLEANFQADGLEERWQAASDEWLMSDAESLTAGVETNFAEVVSGIVQASDELEQRLLAQLKKTRDGLMAKAEEIHWQQLSTLDHLKQIAALNPETKLRPKLDDLNLQSVLQISLNNAEQIFIDVKDYDKSIIDMQRMSTTKSSASILGTIELERGRLGLVELAGVVEKLSGSIKFDKPNGTDDKKCPTAPLRLHDAVKAGDLVHVKKTFSRLPPFCVEYALKHFDFRGEMWDDGELLLHQAAKHGHLDLVRYLIEEQGADPFVQCLGADDLHAMMPVHFGASQGHLDVVRYFTDRWPEMASIADGVGGTPLSEAAEQGQLEIVRFLIEEKGVDPNLNGGDEYEDKTAWFRACEFGQLNVMKYLAEQCHVDVRQVNDNNLTAMHVAAENNKLEIAKYLHRNAPWLLSCGTEIRHELPIHMAAKAGSYRTLRFLIKVGPQHVDARDYFDNTPLTLAASKGSLECVKVLSENGADPAFQTYQNNSAVHHAAGAGHLNVVRYFCELRPELFRLKSIRGSTPLSVAESNNRTLVADYLKPRTPNYHRFDMF